MFLSRVSCKPVHSYLVNVFNPAEINEKQSNQNVFERKIVRTVSKALTLHQLLKNTVRNPIDSVPRRFFNTSCNISSPRNLDAICQ